MPGLDDGGRLSRAGPTSPDVRAFAGIQRGNQRRIEEVAAEVRELDVDVRVLLHVLVDDLAERGNGPRFPLKPDRQIDWLILSGNRTGTEHAAEGRGPEAQRRPSSQDSAPGHCLRAK